MARRFATSATTRAATTRAATTSVTTRAVAAATLVAALPTAVASGCATRIEGHAVGSGLPGAHRALVMRYFDAVNAAAERGSDAQQRLFADDQHPDFRDRLCSLDGLTLTADPAYTTLRTDPDWHLDPGSAPPRGTVYVIAADVTVQQDGAVLANQIGSVHVVILDGTAYGFAPCPA